MNDIAIRAENLGKLYRVGQYVGYKTLREGLMNAISVPFRRFRSVASDSGQKSGDSDPEYIWALKGVSFEVKRGEVVGIIGRNGAGKTTLLKLLSRITEPTEGYAEIHGRVGSLLEVGTGFHPELNGRENIYLNGALLGMKRSEIDRKLDEIIDFAGVEKFIDTPIKRYSGGMQVRLAFSVAAHLEPEILLVDEVLAVGDVQFQNKCLGKMQDISSGGRTVIFVSHNMGAIQRLCERCILLEGGKIHSTGKASDVVNEYLKISLETVRVPLIERREQKDSELVFTAIEFLSSKGERLGNLSSGEDVSIALDYICRSKSGLRNVQVTYNLLRMGEPFVALSTEYSQNFDIIPAKGRIVCHIPKLALMPGQYSIRIRVYSSNVIVNGLRDAASFYVEAGPFFESGLIPSDSGAKFLMAHSWELQER